MQTANGHTVILQILQEIYCFNNRIVHALLFFSLYCTWKQKNAVHDDVEDGPGPVVNLTVHGDGVAQAMGYTVILKIYRRFVVRL